LESQIKNFSVEEAKSEEGRKGKDEGGKFERKTVMSNLLDDKLS
jgi:hypothetical protein